jgi:hypothetical protein
MATQMKSITSSTNLTVYPQPGTNQLVAYSASGTATVTLQAKDKNAATWHDWPSMSAAITSGGIASASADICEDAIVSMDFRLNADAAASYAFDRVARENRGLLYRVKNNE